MFVDIAYKIRWYRLIMVIEPACLIRLIALLVFNTIITIYQ